MEDLITHLDDASGAVLRFGPVLYVVWRDSDAVGVVHSADEAAQALTRRYGRDRKLLYVHRVPESSPIARHTEQTREAVMKHFDRTEALFRASALAIETTGFAGAVVRSVATSVMLVRRSAVKSKVFDDARPGLRWLATMAERDASFDPEAMIAKLAQRNLCRGVGAGPDLAHG